MKILCTWHATASELELIQGLLPSASDIRAPSGEFYSRYTSRFDELRELADGVEVLLGWTLMPELLDTLPDLRLISWLHAGADNLASAGVLETARRRNIRIATVRGANSVAVAEHAMMFVLSLAKQMPYKHNAVLNGSPLFPVWDAAQRAKPLNGSVLGIIGVGSIGAKVAAAAKGFNMQVLGMTRRSTRSDPNVDSMYGPDHLHEMLAEADYVVITAPLTPETRDLIDSRALQAMKASAFLVNVSRGNIVNEKALWGSLMANGIAGYAADVWWNYSYPEEYPDTANRMSRLGVERLPNVLSTLHQAHNMDGVLERSIALGSENVSEYSLGRRLTREVDLGAGY